MARERKREVGGTNNRDLIETERNEFKFNNFDGEIMKAASDTSEQIF